MICVRADGTKHLLWTFCIHGNPSWDILELLHSYCVTIGFHNLFFTLLHSTTKLAPDKLSSDCCYYSLKCTWYMMPLSLEILPSRKEWACHVFQRLYLTSMENLGDGFNCSMICFKIYVWSTIWFLLIKFNWIEQYLNHLLYILQLSLTHGQYHHCLFRSYFNY